MSLSSMRWTTPILVLFTLSACADAAPTLKRINSLDRVQNGGFEQGDLDGCPADWTPKNTDVPDVRHYWSDESPRTGRRCLAIKSDNSASRPWFWWDQNLTELTPGQRYTISGWVRSRDVQRDLGVILYFHNVNNQRIDQVSIHNLPKNATDWARFEQSVVAPAGTTRGILRFTMHGKGQIWLDDVAVVEHWQPRQVACDEVGLYPLERSASPVAIDGNAEDWPDVERARVAAAYEVSQAEAIVIDRERSEGATDLSFDFAMRYDDANLYLLVEVNDNVRQARNPYWKGDGFQCAIDSDYSRSAKGYDAGDLAFGVAMKPTGPEVHVDHGSGLKPEHIRVAAKELGKGYTIEAAVPLARLGLSGLEHNRRIGFSIVVNDNDGEGRKWAEWTPGIAKGPTPVDFGTLLVFRDHELAVSLVAPAVAVPDTKPLPLKAWTIVKGNHPRNLDVTLTIDDGQLGSDELTAEVPPGCSGIPLVYESGSVPAGTHRATVEMGGITSSASFEVSPLRQVIDDTRQQLTLVEQKRAVLSSLINEGHNRGLDMAFPDVTRFVAELFCRWIPADLAHKGLELTAQREAHRVGQRLDMAIAEARRILADGDNHAAVAPPDVLKAEMKRGGWYVGDRPVFLIGLNQLDPAFRTDLRRLGGNFITARGSSAKFMFNDGPDQVSATALETALADVRAATELGYRTNVHFSHAMPDWAIEKYPDISASEGHFLPYDIHHPAARKLTLDAMEAVARTLAGAPGLTCYDLWNEANYFQLSERGLRDFQAAMLTKYGSLARLNATWHKDFTTPDEVRPVFRDPQQQAAYYDWCRWNDSRVTAWIESMKEAVLRGDPNALTTVKIPNEMAVEGSLTKTMDIRDISRHWQGIDRWALTQLLDVQGCDTRPVLQSDEYAFAWRFPGMAYDLQRSMAPNKPIFDGEWHGVQTVFYENPDEPAEFLNAALWFSYLHGMDANVTWWWSRNGAEPKPNWFDGSLLSQPQLLDAFGRNSIQVQRLAPEIVAFQDDAPRVRILFSKTSAILDLGYLDTMREAYTALNWLGAATGFVTEEMLEEEFDEFDLLIVPAAKYTLPKVRQAVSQLASAGTTVVLIGPDCLSRDGHGQPFNSPFSLKATRSASVDKVDWNRLYDEAGIERTARCVGPDGHTARPVEFRSVTHRGRQLGYLIGLGREPTKVHLTHHGEPVRSRSILTGEAFPSERTVKPWDVDVFIIER